MLHRTRECIYSDGSEIVQKHLISIIESLSVEFRRGAYERDIDCWRDCNSGLHSVQSDEFEPRASLGALGHRDLPAMTLRDVADDIQPKPGPILPC